MGRTRMIIPLWRRKPCPCPCPCPCRTMAGRPRSRPQRASKRARAPNEGTDDASLAAARPPRCAGARACRGVGPSCGCLVTEPSRRTTNNSPVSRLSAICTASVRSSRRAGGVSADSNHQHQTSPSLVRTHGWSSRAATSTASPSPWKTTGGCLPPPMLAAAQKIFEYHLVMGKPRKGLQPEQYLRGSHAFGPLTSDAVGAQRSLAVTVDNSFLKELAPSMEGSTVMKLACRLITRVLEQHGTVFPRPQDQRDGGEALRSLTSTTPGGSGCALRLQ